ncbi:MAG: matrixin family metalloprotease, partial [Fimbriimonadaceae bacterium]
VTSPGTPGAGSYATSRHLYLMHSSSAGVASSRTLWSFEDEVPDSTGFSNGWPSVSWGAITPDGLGGLLAAWSEVAEETTSYLTRVSGGSATNHEVMPSDYGPVALVAKGGTVFLKYYDAEWAFQLASLNVATWTTNWTVGIGQGTVPTLALDNGHVVLFDPDVPEIRELDESGSLASTVSTGEALYNPFIGPLGQASIYGSNGTDWGLSEMVTPEYLEAESFSTFSFYPGYLLKDQKSCKTPPLLPVTGPEPHHKGLVNTSTPYKFRFVDQVGAVWTDSQKTQVLKAFTLWNEANAITGLLTNFTCISASPAPTGCAVDATTTEDISLKRESLTPPAAGSFLATGSVMTWSDWHIYGGTIKFTTNTNVVNKDETYLKIALHEIGHALGLDHAGGTNGSSVMNIMGVYIGSQYVLDQKRDDFRGNVSTVVRPCDRLQAEADSHR